MSTPWASAIKEPEAEGCWRQSRRERWPPGQFGCPMRCSGLAANSYKTCWINSLPFIGRDINTISINYNVVGATIWVNGPTPSGISQVGIICMASRIVEIYDITTSAPRNLASGIGVALWPVEGCANGFFRKNCPKSLPKTANTQRYVMRNPT